ncbi:hypothetical protein JY651_08100 [Pyxidicoccus parkwayensis]|uniref:Uncharacterized protein n=1 Tax=Pyxidicoccus parkwayensis TaxID=2813578 RepID=A0ABX7P336_9BACT|nr:hypothetical protein [Pyxidicoccus parkwaysis]QSQ24889.1 hypothetical protein JY651_08100 [Pyxidicoccus parkwaysis]
MTNEKQTAEASAAHEGNPGAPTVTSTLLEVHEVLETQGEPEGWPLGLVERIQLALRDAGALP